MEEFEAKPSGAREDNEHPCEVEPLCIRRRTLMIAGSIAAVIAPRMSLAAGGSDARAYPRAAIAKVSGLVEGEPVAFNYPLEEQPNMIVKLGVPAQGGVGPDRDIVAFSVLCTHMGGSLRGRYRHDSKAVGPCPFHFSTFDLTRGGTPVHASATQNLPQITLVAEGDRIYATGVHGLIYGYRDNLADGSPVVQTA